MAILQPMRYKGYVWPHNPKNYTIRYQRVMAVQKVPYGHYWMESLGQTYRVMSGSGEFVGDGAYEEFKKLAQVYYDSGAGTLVHPCWQGAHVYFVKLALTQTPRKDYVAYTFEFWESYDRYDAELKEVTAAGSGSASPTAAAVDAEQAERWHLVCKGECLWGIAQQYQVSIAQLLQWNPGIKNPNLIYAGQKVRVA